MLACWAVLAPALAFAQPAEPVELSWEAPPDCPRAEEVRAQLRKLASDRQTSSVALRAQATITRSENGALSLRLLVSSGDLSGERIIQGKTCPALAGAAAVVISLLLQSSEPLDQAALGEAPAPSAPTKPAAPPAAPAPPIATTPTTATTTTTTPATPRRIHFILGLPRAQLGVGPLPQASLGVSAAIGVASERWRFLVTGTRWFPPELSVTQEGRSYGARVERTSLGALTCRTALLAPLELAPCLILSVEHLSARGTGGYLAARDASATWLAAGLGLQARVYPTDWLGLMLGVDGQIQASQPRLILGEIGVVERLLPAAATVTVGSEWIF